MKYEPAKQKTSGVWKATIINQKGVMEEVVLFRHLREMVLPYSTFYSRWKKAGYPDPVPSELFAESLVQTRTGYTVDGKWYPSLENLSIHARRAPSTLKKRFKELGCHTATMEQLRERQKSATRPKTIKESQKKAMRNTCRLKKAGEPIPAYADPTYLPHITYGDLCHLSGDRNTGAGRGEISDEEWIASIRPRLRAGTPGVINIPR
jgi:hypothetical protein